VPAAPKVFISYSYDSQAHEDRVLDLANRLRGDGIDAEIDQYETSPPEGWPTWCERRIKSAGFVLLMCTETYLRRVDGEEAPGVGHGVLWEARIVRQLLYDAGSVSARFVPVLFSDGSPDHIPTAVKGAARFVVDDEKEYERLCRLLTAQPRVLKPVLGKPKTLPPKERKSSGLAGVSSGTHPRVEDVFVGREADLKKLAAYLFPEDGSRRPVVVSGMAGVGKSYLVDRFYAENKDRFYAENKDRFPGGYIRLALDPENPAAAAELLAQIADRLKLPPGDAGVVAAQIARWRRLDGSANWIRNEGTNSAPLSPRGRSPTCCSRAAISTKRCASTARSSCRSTSGWANCGRRR
jgi:hypothetical protein